MCLCSFFFFNDTATTEIYTLSLHDALPITATGQPFSHFTWAYAVPAGTAGESGAAGGDGPRRLPFGPVGDLAVEQGATALLTGAMGSEPAYWKRYRGGTSGRRSEERRVGKECRSR